MCQLTGREECFHNVHVYQITMVYTLNILQVYMLIIPR